MTFLVEIFMYDLFNNNGGNINTAFNTPEFTYVINSYKKEIKNIKEYYRSRIFTVRSSHLLCRILTQAMAGIENDIYTFSDIVSARVENINRVFNLTSATTYGRMHDSVFYKGPETIISTNGPVDLDTIEDNWKEAEPVKVVYHTTSNLGLLLPLGKADSSEYGLSVIDINIELLCLQYRCFLLEQNRKITDVSDSVVMSPEYFVHMYVLPNMLGRQLDLTIFNRFINIMHGDNNGKAFYKHPFNIVNYGSKLDSVLNELLDFLTNRPCDYKSVLKSFPSVCSDNLLQTLKLPDVSLTRQVWWGLLLSRLKICKTLLELGGDPGVRRNTSLLNALIIDLKYMKTSRVLESMLPVGLLDAYNQEIDFIINY
jgi:hypothetical protein